MNAVRLFALALPLVACDGTLAFDVGMVGGDAGVHDASGGGTAEGGSGNGGDGGAAGRTSASCSEDCASFGLVCSPGAGYCVECQTEKDCAGALPHCLLDGEANHRCVQCRNEADCDGNYCEPISHRCLNRCETEHDASCGTREAECNLRNGYCMACDEDRECFDPDRSRCLPGGAGCVGCLSSSECSEGLAYCDPVLFQCVDCRDSLDCPAPGICDPVSHACR